MKKILLLVLTLSFSTAFAYEDFEDELKLPEAHYSPKTKKVVVEVTPDYRNSQNLQKQEELVETIVQDNGERNVIIVDKTKNDSEE